MAYGRYSKSSKRTWSKRRSTRGRRRYSGYGNRKTAKPRFATVGFARNVEKKYFDKGWSGNSIEAAVGQPSNQSNNGYMYISSNWQTYNFNNNLATGTTVSNDMFKGLETGTTARTRIGNKVKPLYLKGALTFTAAVVNKSVNNQGGEQIAAPSTTGLPEGQYLRTTYRVCIVKDLQVNSSDSEVTWPMVFETQTNFMAGVHSELNVNNMGRFIVLDDKIFTLDGQNPQKTCSHRLNGSSIGSVRYNGPSGAALTDKGCYIVYAAFVMGTGNIVATDILLPPPAGHNRLCFTDD